MATIANLKSYKAGQGPWPVPGKPEFMSFEYDFAKDGGAVGEYPIFKAGKAMQIRLAQIIVDTLCTSGGSATLGAGKASDLAGIIGATAVASLTAGAVINGASPDASHVLAKDDIVYAAIGTAALTAGKCRFVFEVLPV